jgi:hypothetical protein
MWLDDPPRREALEHELMRVHVDLKCDASARAAQAVLDLVAQRRLPPKERLA